MPDGILDKMKNIARGVARGATETAAAGFKFAKNNLPGIAATAMFGPGAGIAVNAYTKARSKKENIRNTARETMVKAGGEAASEAASGVLGTAIAKGGMNATRKNLVPTMHKTLTKKINVPMHESSHKKMTATKKVVKKKPVSANMDNILNKKENTRPDYY